jgi:uncharacterized membrane protein YeaQ/YmgE (transglycosylase-associated protein family)
MEIRMSIIGWIVLGLIAGFIASKIVNKRGEGLILDIVLGVVGAVVGGYLFSMFGAQGVDGVNLYSMGRRRSHRSSRNLSCSRWPPDNSLALLERTEASRTANANCTALHLTWNVCLRKCFL